MALSALDNHTTDNLAHAYRYNIEDAIAGNRLVEALNILQDFVTNLAPRLKHSTLLLRRRHSEFREDKLNNVADPQEVDAIASSILQIVAEAEQHLTILPRYDIAAHGGRQTHNAADRPPLQLVPLNNSSVSSAAADTVGAQHGEVDTDDQLRNYWKIYRSSQPPEDTTAVICQNITKCVRGGRFKLEHLSFSLKVGQITGVVGRNASGKTTLLRMVRAEIIPDSGTITYPALTRDREGWVHLKRQISFIPQSLGSWAGRVKTNLKFVASAHGTTGKRNQDLVDWHLQRYGLSDYQNSTLKMLSGGFRMRYALVEALVSRPHLLILDEPLANLDVLARQEFLKNLRAIAYSLERPIPIMITSQHLYEIDSIADQMIVLDDGQCLFNGPVEKMQHQSETRLYEPNTKLSKRSMQDRLTQTGMKILETIADGYIIEVPNRVLPAEMIKPITELFGDDLYGIRDITNSSRRFFISGS